MGRGSAAGGGVNIQFPNATTRKIFYLWVPFLNAYQHLGLGFEMQYVFYDYKCQTENVCGVGRGTEKVGKQRGGDNTDKEAVNGVRGMEEKKRRMERRRGRMGS